MAALDAVDVSGEGRPLLRNVSLSLRPGMLLVVGGPSGSGKSTLLRLLSGLVRPARGTVSGGGIDLTSASPRGLSAWRRQIGIYSADFPLAEDWTASDNLLAALGMQGPRLLQIAAGRVTHVLGRWGLLPRRHTKAVRLTDTERARLALARAFVRSPIAAFLDEPLALIPETEYCAIMAEVKLAAKLGTAVLVATTRWERWSTIADELHIIRNGRLSAPPSVPAAETGAPV